ALICGDKVVCASGDGRVYILDLKSGKKLWSYDTAASIKSSPVVLDGLIYIANDNGVIFAFGESN
ncbi:MAG: PQQ-binding-like beta-propeller repeat protein, partial [Lentisphaeria bacterium]|nr:PQQ-binding-like beta-propeller repeat protein [Lentisphaeria bacterium]NQZ68851.1 PQQ-binding-like beta-propeller repeat protein [Lentisphaeria bacterium]